MILESFPTEELSPEEIRAKAFLHALPSSDYGRGPPPPASIRVAAKAVSDAFDALISARCENEKAEDVHKRARAKYDACAENLKAALELVGA